VGRFRGDIEICVKGRWRHVKVQKTADIICHLQLYNRRGGYKSQSNTVFLERETCDSGFNKFLVPFLEAGRRGRISLASSQAQAQALDPEQDELRVERQFIPPATSRLG
jgi:hypothetical protein